MINNQELCLDYEEFTNHCVKKQYDGIEMDYMMKRFGFARLDGDNIIMIAKREYSKELSDYLKDCEELGYIFAYVSCYKEIIFQQYKNVVFKKQEDLQERLKV